MLKIIKRNENEIRHGVDYKLENGVCLFEDDWNGEHYLEGAVDKGVYWQGNEHEYYPVRNGNGVVEGFEEV